MFILKAGSAGLTSLQQAGKIKSGDVLNIKVVRMLEGSSWQINVHGKLMAVSSAVPLKPGMNFKAKALFSSGQLLLKIIDQNPLDRLAGEAALPKDDLSQAILKSFIRSSIPFSPEKAAFIYSFLKNIRSEKKSLIRLFTLLSDKGIPLKNEIFEEAAFLVQGRGGDDRKKGGGDREREGRREKQVKEALKSIVEEGESGKGNLMQLFNHLQSTHENWLVFPFDMETDRGGITGCIRCKLRDTAPRSSRKSNLLNHFSAVVLEISEETEPFIFNITERDDGSAGLSIISNIRKINDFPADVFNKFKEKLRNMGVSLDENIVEAGTFDGFDFEGTYTPVDAVV